MKNQTFGPKKLNFGKINEILVKNEMLVKKKFDQKMKVWSKKWNIGQKSEILVKKWNFAQKMKFCSKNEILLKKWNFAQKMKFDLKK